MKIAHFIVPGAYLALVTRWRYGVGAKSGRRRSPDIGSEAVNGVGEHQDGGRQRRDRDQDVAHVRKLSQIPERIYGRRQALDEGAPR